MSISIDYNNIDFIEKSIAFNDFLQIKQLAYFYRDNTIVFYYQSCGDGEDLSWQEIIAMFNEYLETH